MQTPPQAVGHLDELLTRQAFGVDVSPKLDAMERLVTVQLPQLTVSNCVHDSRKFGAHPGHWLTTLEGILSMVELGTVASRCNPHWQSDHQSR